MHFFQRLEKGESVGRTSRRSFLALTAGATLLAACDSDDNDEGADVVLDFSNDFGVLNYAYALEQLEAAFYARVIQSPYSGISSAETAILTDIRDHEAIHRDFFMAALGTNAIGALTPDFSAIDFGSRASVLGAARTFEDLGVSAYNGAGQYLQSDDFLTIAGKIVSVEARHASVIRDLLSPGTNSFADLASLSALGADAANGLDAAASPQAVVSAAAPFIKGSIRVRNA